MKRPSFAGEPGAPFQRGADGFRLFGRPLALGVEIEIQLGMSGSAGATDAPAWTPAIVSGIEADSVILATPFATLRAHPSLIARWPSGAASPTRRELAHTLTTSLTSVAHHLLELGERFEHDPAMRTNPTAALKGYVTALDDESAVLRSLGLLLGQVAAELEEKSMPPLVIFPAPREKSGPSRNTFFAKRASQNGA